MAANILYVVYLGLTNPNDTKLGLRMEYINESFLQLTSYHLALFPLAPTLADEELAGWSMVGTIGAVFLINLCVMIVMSICGLRRKLYLRRLKKENERRFKEKLAQVLAVESNRPLATVLEKYTMEDGALSVRKKDQSKYKRDN